MDLVRKVFAERSQNQVGSLTVIFRSMDSYDRNRRLDKPEFERGLSEYGIILPTAVLEGVFLNFDHNKDGTIDLSEFMSEVRGDIPAKRLEAFEALWERLDRGHRGVVALETILLAFNPNHHPRVRTKEMSVEEVRSIFDKCFRTLSERIHHRGVVSREEFLDYFRDISSTIKDDAHFEMFLRRCFDV